MRLLETAELCDMYLSPQFSSSSLSVGVVILLYMWVHPHSVSWTLPNLRDGDASTEPSCAACTSPDKRREFGFALSLHSSVMQKVAISSCLPPPELPVTGNRDNGCTACPAWVPLADLSTGHFIHLTKGSIALLPWERPASWMATASCKGGENTRAVLKRILYLEQAVRGILMNI